MKILITGANGYVGKSLYNALKDKYEVATITRDKCDLTNSENVNFYFLDTWFDIIIHCAVKGGSRLVEDKWDIIDTNLIMYYNLLSNKSHFKKLIHFGSGAETYMSKEPYGYSKKVIAKSILNQPNFYNLKVFGLFDENELDTRFIKSNIKKYLNKEPMQVYQNKAMDFFYMPDLINVVEYYINEKESLKEFDCIYPHPVNLIDIANIINNLDNYKVEIQIHNEELDVPYISLYRDPLPTNFIGLEEGIKQVYNKLK
jgi:GDP-L-fucose synthase